MREITLTRRCRYAGFGFEFIDAYLDWLSDGVDYAIVRLYTDIGLQCMLNISQGLRGTLFECNHGTHRFVLSIEEVVLEDDEIVKMVFLVEDD